MVICDIRYHNDDLFINPDNPDNDELRKDDLRQIALRKVLDQGNPQAITNTLWSYATLGYRYDDLFINPNPLRRNALYRVLKQGNSQAITNTLWSYATLGYRNDDLFINLTIFIHLKKL